LIRWPVRGAASIATRSALFTRSALSLITLSLVTLLSDLLSTLPQQGRLEWIGVRPARREPVQSTTIAQLKIGSGLVGDRYRGNADSKRQVTLIQAEHLDVSAKL
jgi:hypothetical protein